MVNAPKPANASVDDSGAGWKVRNVGASKPEAKGDTVPSGTIFEMVLSPTFDAKRLPLLSTARPRGLFNPDAKEDMVPSGAISEMVLLSRFATKRSPLLLKARPRGAIKPEANVVTAPSGVIFKIVLSP